MFARWNIFVAIAVFAASSAAAFELPSGLRPDLSEVLVDSVGPETWLRFRFVDAQLDKSSPDALAFSDIEGDFALICAALALPYAEKYGLTADKVIVSLADRFVAYGTTNPSATQYFEQFRIENGDCIWEGF